MGSDQYCLLTHFLISLSFGSFGVVESRSSSSCTCTCSDSDLMGDLPDLELGTMGSGRSLDPCPRPNSQAQARIYGGSQARAGERPFQINIVKIGTPICGGVIYNSRTVLTAAHCLRDTPPKAISSIAGALSREAYFSGGGQSISGAQLVIHPKYNTSSKAPEYDVALIRLGGSFKYNQLVQPIGLIEPSVDLVGKLVVVSGWGQIQKGKGKKKYPATLRMTELTVISAQDCAQQISSAGYKDITEKSFKKKICASGITSTTSGCPGDSGGPLTCKVDGPTGTVTKLCGLVHAGYGCGCGLPDLYTSLTYPEINKWIRDTAGEADEPTIISF